MNRAELDLWARALSTQRELDALRIFRCRMSSRGVMMPWDSSSDAAIFGQWEDIHLRDLYAFVGHHLGSHSARGSSPDSSPAASAADSASAQACEDAAPLPGAASGRWSDEPWAAPGAAPPPAGHHAADRCAGAGSSTDLPQHGPAASPQREDQPRRGPPTRAHWQDQPVFTPPGPPNADLAWRPSGFAGCHIFSDGSASRSPTDRLAPPDGANSLGITFWHPRRHRVAHPCVRYIRGNCKAGYNCQMAHAGWLPWCEVLDRSYQHMQSKEGEAEVQWRLANGLPLPGYLNWEHIPDNLWRGLRRPLALGPYAGQRAFHAEEAGITPLPPGAPTFGGAARGPPNADTDHSEAESGSSDPSARGWSSGYSSSWMTRGRTREQGSHRSRRPPEPSWRDRGHDPTRSARWNPPRCPVLGTADGELELATKIGAVTNLPPPVVGIIARQLNNGDSAWLGTLQTSSQALREHVAKTKVALFGSPLLGFGRGGSIPAAPPADAEFPGFVVVPYDIMGRAPAGSTGTVPDSLVCFLDPTPCAALRGEETVPAPAAALHQWVGLVGFSNYVVEAARRGDKAFAVSHNGRVLIHAPNRDVSRTLARCRDRAVTNIAEVLRSALDIFSGLPHHTLRALLADFGVDISELLASALTRAYDQLTVSAQGRLLLKRVEFCVNGALFATLRDALAACPAGRPPLAAAPAAPDAGETPAAAPPPAPDTLATEEDLAAMETQLRSATLSDPGSGHAFLLEAAAKSIARARSAAAASRELDGASARGSSCRRAGSAAREAQSVSFAELPQVHTIPGAAADSAAAAAPAGASPCFPAQVTTRGPANDRTKGTAPRSDSIPSSRPSSGAGKGAGTRQLPVVPLAPGAATQLPAPDAGRGRSLLPEGDTRRASTEPPPRTLWLWSEVLDDLDERLTCLEDDCQAHLLLSVKSPLDGTSDRPRSSAEEAPLGAGDGEDSAALGEGDAADGPPLGGDPAPHLTPAVSAGTTSTLPATDEAPPEEAVLASPSPAASGEQPAELSADKHPGTEPAPALAPSLDAVQGAPSASTGDSSTPPPRPSSNSPREAGADESRGDLVEAGMASPAAAAPDSVPLQGPGPSGGPCVEAPAAPAQDPHSAQAAARRKPSTNKIARSDYRRPAPPPPEQARSASTLETALWMAAPPTGGQVPPSGAAAEADPVPPPQGAPAEAGPNNPADSEDTHEPAGPSGPAQTVPTGLPDPDEVRWDPTLGDGTAVTFADLLAVHRAVGPLGKPILEEALLKRWTTLRLAQPGDPRAVLVSMSDGSTAPYVRGKASGASCASAEADASGGPAAAVAAGPAPQASGAPVAQVPPAEVTEAAPARTPAPAASGGETHGAQAQRMTLFRARTKHASDNWRALTRASSATRGHVATGLLNNLATPGTILPHTAVSGLTVCKDLGCVAMSLATPLGLRESPLPLTDKQMWIHLCLHGQFPDDMGPAGAPPCPAVTRCTLWSSRADMVGHLFDPAHGHAIGLALLRRILENGPSSGPYPAVDRPEKLWEILLECHATASRNAPDSGAGAPDPGPVTFVPAPSPTPSAAPPAADSASAPPTPAEGIVLGHPAAVWHPDRLDTHPYSDDSTLALQPKIEAFELPAWADDLSYGPAVWRIVSQLGGRCLQRAAHAASLGRFVCPICSLNFDQGEVSAHFSSSTHFESLRRATEERAPTAFIYQCPGAELVIDWRQAVWYQQFPAASGPDGPPPDLPAGRTVEKPPMEIRPHQANDYAGTVIDPLTYRGGILADDAQAVAMAAIAAYLVDPEAMNACPETFCRTVLRNAAMACGAETSAGVVTYDASGALPPRGRALIDDLAAMQPHRLEEAYSCGAFPQHPRAATAWFAKHGDAVASAGILLSLKTGVLALVWPPRGIVTVDFMGLLHPRSLGFKFTTYRDVASLIDGLPSIFFDGPVCDGRHCVTLATILSLSSP